LIALVSPDSLYVNSVSKFLYIFLSLRDARLDAEVVVLHVDCVRRQTDHGFVVVSYAFGLELSNLIAIDAYLDSVALGPDEQSVPFL